MPSPFAHFPAFDNAFLRALPGDPQARNVPRQVTGALWSDITTRE